MNIFTDARMGTPITPEEREWIKQEIATTEALLTDEVWIENYVKGCHEDGMTSFDRELVIMCIQADLYGMKRCLKYNYVLLW